MAGATNVLYLHSGALAEEVAASNGTWSWWDDFVRGTLQDAGQSWQDASCYDPDHGYFCVAMNAPTGVLWRIKDSDQTVTELTLSGRGSGADMVYDSSRAVVWVLWGDENSGTPGISCVDVATWTELSFTAYSTLSPVTNPGGRPSIALNYDATYLYVATYNDALVQRLSIGAGPTYPVSHNALLRLWSDAGVGYHCIRLDAADASHDLYVSGAARGGLARIRADLSVVWNRITAWEVHEGTYLPSMTYHDDLQFDATYVYAPGSPLNGVQQYRKATGEFVGRVARDQSNVAVAGAARSTTKLYAPSQAIRGVQAVDIQTGRVTYRQSDHLHGQVDDLSWTGSRLWTTHASSFKPTYVFPDVIGWSQVDGPAGCGRIRCTPSASTPQYVRAGAQGASNGGVYAGGRFWVEHLSFNSAHWTCLTLSTDTSTANWFAKLVVEPTTGQVTLLLPGGVSYAGRGPAAHTVSAGWCSLELRYDEAVARFRVYVGPGAPCLDVSGVSGVGTVGGVIYGPWDADQTESYRWGVHAAFDVGLDALTSDYGGARWGPVTAIRSTAAFLLNGDAEFTAVGESQRHLCVADQPDLLTPSPRENASGYLSATGAADLWQTFGNTDQIAGHPLLAHVRHARVGARAKRTSAGQLKLGYGAASALTKTDTWNLTGALTLSASSAWYERRASSGPGGGALSDGEQRLAIVYVGNSGDAIVTQCYLSQLWQEQPVDWGQGVIDTTALDVPASGFAVDLLRPPMGALVTLDVPARGFAVRTVYAPPDPAAITLMLGSVGITGAVATLASSGGNQNAAATIGIVSIAGEIATAATAATLIGVIGQITVVGDVSSGTGGNVGVATTLGAVSFVGEITSLSTQIEVAVVSAAMEVTGEAAVIVAGDAAILTTVAMVSIVGETTTLAAGIIALATVGAIILDGDLAIASAAILVTTTASTLTLVGEIVQEVAGGTAATATVGTITAVGEIADIAAATGVAPTTGALLVEGKVATVSAATALAATLGSSTLDGLIATMTGGGLTAQALVGAVTVEGRAATAAPGGIVGSADVGALIVGGETALVDADIVLPVVLAAIAATGEIAALAPADMALQATVGIVAIAGSSAALQADVLLSIAEATLVLTEEIVTPSPGTAAAEATIASVTIAGEVATIAAGGGPPPQLVTATVGAVGLVPNLISLEPGPSSTATLVGEVLYAGETAVLLSSISIPTVPLGITLVGAVPTLLGEATTTADMAVLTVFAFFPTLVFDQATLAAVGYLALAGEIGELLLIGGAEIRLLASAPTIVRMVGRYEGVAL